MRQSFVFAGQSCCGDLGHHEPGIQAGISGQERRQSFIQCRIHQSLNAPLGNSSKRSQYDREIVERKRQRLTVEVAAGKYVAFGWAVDEDQWIVVCRIHCDFEGAPAKLQRIAYRAMDLWNTTQRISVLHTAAVLVRFAYLASREQTTQVGCDFHLSGMRPCGVDAFV